MGEIVNLRRARKQAERKLSEQAAAANRLAYGRGKADRALDQAKGERALHELDQHRVATGDER